MPLSSKNTGKREIYVKNLRSWIGIRISKIGSDPEPLTLLVCRYQYPSTIKNESLQNLTFSHLNVVSIEGSSC
jgi:hypothetical protein